MGLERTIIYLDSCLVIYLVEKHEDFFSALQDKIASSTVIFAVSDLTLMECLVIPTRKNDGALIQRYRAWFAEASMLSLGTDVFEKAAKLRADHSSLKTPDALHLGAALDHNCDELWTNDNRLVNVAPAIVKNIFNNLFNI